MSILPCMTDKPLEALAEQPTPKTPESPDQWMVAFAKNTDLDQLKFPVCLVQEYGISVFRLAAIASLTLEKSENCQLLTETQVTSISQNKQDHSWSVETSSRLNSQQEKKQTFEVDYLINACGFRTGTIDDMVGLQPKRMVEFKAAYVSHWSCHENNWPEIIFHGTRGTSKGMTQLTPYPNGYFQIHAMTPEVTLFEDGLVSSAVTSAQPQLPKKFIAKVNHQWDPTIIKSRTSKAIDKVAAFIPSFGNATVGGPPMYGAQQIPGSDASLRVADVAFENKTYARCEIVKASSALPAADTIIAHLIDHRILPKQRKANHENTMTHQLAEVDVSQRAESLAIARNFPKAMARRTNVQTNSAIV